jgi:hypothetical protein
MRVLLLAAAVAGAVVVDARAETTLYQPSAISRAHHGYAETQIEANRLRVTFSGNTETSRETVETSLLFRSAELTLAHGYDYFVVADHNVEVHTQYAAAGPPVPPIVPARRYREITSYSAVSDIIMHRGVRPPNAANAFDARTVHANLAWRISRPH